MTNLADLLKKKKMLDDYLEMLGWQLSLSDENPCIRIYHTDRWMPHIRVDTVEEALGYVAGYVDALRGNTIIHNTHRLPFRSKLLAFDEREFLNAKSE